MRQDRHVQNLRQPAQAGFTLVELMIALGIMVIGFSMLATSFPVAIVEHRESVNKTMSAMICQNAIGIARSRFRHSDGSDGSPTLNDKSLANGMQEMTGLLGPNDRVFPVPDMYEEGDWLDWPSTKDPASRYTFLIAIRQLVPNVNYYQLAIVACRKFNVGDTDTLKLYDCGINAGKATGGVSVGSPVIIKSGPDAGRWAVVYKSDGSLDRPLPDCPAPGAYCVKNGKSVDGDSPAIGCMVTMFSTQR